MILLTFFLALLFLGPQLTLAQIGCTDPLANNYDAQATQNDGSCTYSLTNYQPERRAALPSPLNECSGLSWIEGELWAHNDNFNPPLLYQIDTLDATILRSVVLTNATNTDWEDMATNEEYLFIGDFGNNEGSRRDLRIYRMAKTALLQDTIRMIDTINFAFSDQTNFDPAELNTSYDCEAFFATEDSIHLFSKDWVNQKTKHYVLPNQPGDHLAQLKDSLNTQALITAADRAADGVIALLGYDGLTSVLWLLFDYPEGQVFEGNKRRIELGSLTTLGQTEGISFSGQGEGYLSSESLFTFPAQLFRFRTAQWTTPIATALEEQAPASFDPQLFPNPFGDYFYLQNINSDEALELRLYDLLGRQKWQSEDWSAGEKIDWSELAPGNYWLNIRQGRGEKWISVGHY